MEDLTTEYLKLVKEQLRLANEIIEAMEKSIAKKKAMTQLEDIVARHTALDELERKWGILPKKDESHEAE